MTDDNELEPRAFFDLSRQNPWWDEHDALPERGQPRTDLYWRVKNTLDNDVLVIPGPPVTGTTSTVRQSIRALALGGKHEHERIATLFRQREDIDAEGYLPEQLCYVDCTDPIAHLDEGFVETVRRSYHQTGAQTGTLEYFVFFDGIHHIEDWREQLLAARDRLAREFPEDWTLVATTPFADSTSGVEGKAPGTVDRPHHTQKYRDTLFQAAPELRETVRGTDTGDLVAEARTALTEGSAGDVVGTSLAMPFEQIVGRVREQVDNQTLEATTDQYLTEGGFGPALDVADASAGAVAAHVERGIEQTLYRDLPRLARSEESVPRVNHPEELHALVALLARRQFEETSYIALGEFLSCDTRTIRQKYVPLLEQFYLGARATRYDLERNRTLRFFPRGPGYATAFRAAGVSDADRTDRLRITLADHLRRLLASLGGTGGLQYWRDDEHLVDYLLELDGNPVPFVSTFADSVGSSTAALEAFATKVQSPNVEVVLANRDAEVNAEERDSGHSRLVLPYWAILTVC